MSTSSIGDGGLGEYYPQATPSSQTAITAFLAKLWALVNDPSCDDLIAWDPSGSSFHVYDQARFAREILPRYFKHNNFASFIRQLNMYGFRKISTIEHGSLKNEGDDIEFAHPSFIRGHDTLLELIKRRAPDTHQHKTNPQSNKTDSPSAISPSTSSSSSALVSSTTSSSAATTTTTNHLDNKSTTARPVEFSHVLSDVRNLQTKQTSLSDKLSHMQDENQALWREIGSLKQKHAKQQQIVTKLVEFLLHIITNSTHPNRPSVEQRSTTSSQPQAHNIITNQPIGTNSLKRKPAALMLSEEPRKRTTMPPPQQQQQRQHQQTPQQLFPLINIGRQQGIVINELTDTDSNSWSHTADASPVIDLVRSPSPPNAVQSLNESYPLGANYGWSDQSDDLHQPLNFPLQTTTTTNENGNGTSDSYIPDFFLTTEQNHGATKLNFDQTNLPSINTVNIDADIFFDML